MLTRTLLIALLVIVPARADEFFESKIRPQLVEHCFRCHSDQAKEPKGGLRLDSRTAILKGGDSGPAVVVKEPAKSKLIEALKYANTDMQMPPKGKLSDAVIKDFEKWIADGAAWSGDDAKTEMKVTAFDLAKRKAEHWAWQAVKKYDMPAVKDKAWVRDPVDAFLLAKLEGKGIAPAKAAGKLVWLRRVTFAITGLPPTVAEIEAFQNDDSAKAFETVVDRLLASPHYGERWGRHWLDLVRYAEGRGHEFDYEIPNAWLYRDYVVLAFNDDLPYTDFVFEQIAGTTSKGPRYSGGKSTNESAIGTAFWRLGEEVHSPVDIRQDQADHMDNRIDVFGKTVLGLTIACARCHDHKFDAISTKDYYSLYGILKAGPDVPVRIDNEDHNSKLALERGDILRQGARWLERTREQEQSHQEWLKSVKLIFDYTGPTEGRGRDVGFADYTFRRCEAGECSEVVRDGKRSIRREERGAVVYDPFWQKLAVAKGMTKEIGKLGEYRRVGNTIYSPAFTLEKENVYMLVRGGGYSYATVGNYTLINGPLHGSIVQAFKNVDEYRWVKHPLKDYKGQSFRMQISADPASNFAIAMIVQGDTEPTLPPKFDVEPMSEENAKKIMAKLDSLPQPVWESRLVPGVHDAIATGEHVFIRGNHRTPGEFAPPRFLEAFGPAQAIQLKPFEGIGDFEKLARQVTDPQFNPFLGRVMVNRVWHHLFGRGIVASTDNFGVLGERPTHPELLDYLAIEFQNNGWYLKPLIKRLVLSNAYRMESATANHPDDPANLLLHHFRIKRIEGEAIRDAMLMASGRLDLTIGGPPVPMHLTVFMEGRGKPGESGPRDGNGRRSIYLAVRRNFLSPFLLAFDSPIPFSTVGTRQVSNVPAQSLILMNDPFVHEQTKRWGAALAAKGGSIDERIAEMYLKLFARKPTDAELAACREMVSGRPQSWVDLAHALLNVKEFRYVP